MFASGARVADDIILTNVIGFDVKAWDPTYNGGVGGYVDLGYNNADYAATYTATANGLSHLGHPKSQLEATTTTPRIYDTYSTHYEAWTCRGFLRAAGVEPSIASTMAKFR